MRVAVVGGGPGGLYLAALVKQVEPAHEVMVWERGARDETFGFGVVFSDGALGGIGAADPALSASIADHFARWERVDVRYRGETVSQDGYRFSAIERRTLLRLLRERARAVGATLHFGRSAPPVEELRSGFDLVVAADGVGSEVRAAHDFGTESTPRDSRFLWLGTDREFDALTFGVVETPHGVMQVHAYPYAPGRSTFIVETTDAVLARSGLDAPDRAPEGPIADLFADLLEGHRVVCRTPRWGRFTSVRNERWSRDGLVLLGDAAHTTHFSIGSGTKLAMEDALALAMALSDHGAVPEALAAYEAERKPVVARMQRVAEISRDWFERVAEHVGAPAPEFAGRLLTRSGRIGHRDLPLLDRDHVRRVREWFGRAPAGVRP
ncbi:FAD-dependent monooxygenase [Actinosynnema sp. NPDC020468]|uniref:FAD-dependent monooxygenase n=1 Tax=Actinosynnema sp. NPDC020468 TaxID=3154488 RepID=UPI0033E32132